MNNDRNSSPTGPLPLAIGITGHMDLVQDTGVLEGLENAVRKIFVNLRKSYPHTRLLLLSSLAEGADRLAARVGLEESFKDDSGQLLQPEIELVAALPMPVEEYEKDFGTGKSISEFRDLLGKTKRPPIIMPAVPKDTRSATFDPRELQYALVGSFIARYSQILIALWNGVPSEKIGGTAYTVQFNLDGEFKNKELQYCLENVPEPYRIRLSLLHPPESGPVYRIVTPRLESPEIDGDPFQLKKLYHRDFEGKEKEAGEYYAKIYRLIDEFNQDSFLTDKHLNLQKLRIASSENLLPQNQAGALLPALIGMRENYAIADTLAQFFQQRTEGTLIKLCLLALFAALSLEIHTHLLRPGTIPWPLAFYHIALSVVALLYLRAKRLNYQNKHQDYRALTEGMRVQVFWRLAGLTHSAADHYLRKQSNVLEWIPNALRNWSLLCAPQSEGRWDLVQRYWILGQDTYFRKALWRCRKKLYLLHSAAKYSFLFATILLLGLFLKEWIHAANTPGPPANIGIGTLNTSSAAILLAAGFLVVCFFVYTFIRQIRSETSELWEEYHSLRDDARQNLETMNEFTQLFMDRVLLICAVLVGVLSLAALLYFLRTLLGLHPPEHLLHGLLILVVIILAVIGGLIHFYVDKKAMPELVKQYKRMILIFDNARSNLNALGIEGMVELGREALLENGDWVLLHRERPLEVPRH